MTENLAAGMKSIFPDNTAIVVVNRQARADALHQPAIKPKQIAELFEALNVTPDIYWIEPQRLPRVLQRIAENAPESIIIGGGDGTLNAAANVFAGTSTAVGILPLGTFNHLAKDLQIPMHLDDAVHTSINGTITQIDLGQINDKVFVNHASVGIYPHVVTKRKTYQRTLGLGRFSAMGYALIEALFRQPVMQLDLQHGHTRQVLKTPFVFVGNNRFQTTPFSFIRRQTLDSGHLHVVYVPQLPALTFLKIALGILFRGLRNAPELHEQWRTSITITGRSKPFKVSLDGEVVHENPPLEFRSQPQSLRVIVPAPEC